MRTERGWREAGGDEAGTKSYSRVTPAPPPTMDLIVAFIPTLSPVKSIPILTQLIKYEVRRNPTKPASLTSLIWSQYKTCINQLHTINSSAIRSQISCNFMPKYFHFHIAIYITIFTHQFTRYTPYAYSFTIINISIILESIHSLIPNRPPRLLFDSFCIFFTYWRIIHINCISFHILCSQIMFYALLDMDLEWICKYIISSCLTTMTLNVMPQKIEVSIC